MESWPQWLLPRSLAQPGLDREHTWAWPHQQEHCGSGILQHSRVPSGDMLCLKVLNLLNICSIRVQRERHAVIQQQSTKTIQD